MWNLVKGTRKQLLEQAKLFGVKNPSRMTKSCLAWHIARGPRSNEDASPKLVSSVKTVEELQKIAKGLGLIGFSTKRKLGLIKMINAAVRQRTKGE